nr:hypothetical protein [uncultured Tyzzerella sp.]
MKENTCFIIGHRVISKKNYNIIYYLTKVVVEILIVQKNITNFKIGYTKGFSNIAFSVLTELKNIYPNINLTLVLHNTNLNKIYYKIFKNVDNVLYVSKNYILEESNKLIENSEYCVCFFIESIKRGRTFKILNKADKNNIKIYNIFKYL